MRTFVVETSDNSATDGLQSFQEAWRKANAYSAKTGETATIAFAGETAVIMTGQLKVRAGADIVVDGRIENDESFEVGTSDVVISGNSGVGYNPLSDTQFGFTMFAVETGGSLRMIDVTLSNHLHAAAAGRDGRSGTDGINGIDGEDNTPGTSGNGGLSVSSPGGNGKAAVGGILNNGTLVLDRVNFNSLSAFGGNGGDGGSGGNGGTGGSSDSGVGGPGGPGGSGLSLGGDGGLAAAGILNRGDLTLIDTWFQSNTVSAGQGGAGGNGGNGGDGGFGGIGGFGGNGGFAGNGGNGANGAATVMNLGTMKVTGGWADGDNIIFANSGAAGSRGLGGDGGAGGGGADENSNGLNGQNRPDGGPGVAGTSAEATGVPKGFTATTLYVETVAASFDEFTGGVGGNAITIAIYRLGATGGAASVDLSLAGLGGATGSGIQGGLFSNRVVAFNPGQQVALVTLFTAFDGSTADTQYRLTISSSSGGVIGGNRTADFTISNSEVIGTSGNDTLRGTSGAEIIVGGLGNDTIVATGGNDRYDGLDGIDWLDLARVSEGAEGEGAVADLLGLSVSGEGIGTNLVLNIENVRGSAYDDTMTGTFSSNVLLGLNGDDILDGGFNTDTLNGGRGRDELTGGDSEDRFVLDSGAVGSLARHADRITDFVSGTDTIVLVSTGTGPFDTLALGDLDSRTFHIGTDAEANRHRIVYDGTTGALYYDPDGSGAAAKELIARLVGAPNLAFTDFEVI